jgi:eukaryotic-like serine/threonine-protein kinase
MALAPGTKIGSYEIQSPLGAGGMGEVYRARDPVLKRDVALKVLPAAFAQDPERMSRFQREAELLASLNHPNIAIVHGLVESNGQRALVMELVPGETLASTIKRNAIPASESLNVARQIAEALEAAHEKGVVHRDMKPGNVMITPSGLVKVLDFGLAASIQGAPSAPSNPAHSLPSTMGVTQAGVIMGTTAYMSPEQAAGTPLDRRSDIWSFGVVLWEMLSGRPLFGGDTNAHTLADVLRSSIDFDSLTAPAPIKNLLRRCLDRDARTRLRDIGEARVAISRFLADPASGREDAPKPARQWVAWAVAAAFAALAFIGWLGLQLDGPVARATELMFTIAPAAGGLAPVGELHATPEISPDGSAVIFYGDGAQLPFSGNSAQLRQFNQLSPEPVHTGGLRNPGFWSADSRSFVFSDGVNLKKMQVPGGAPEVIANDVGTLLGGSSSDDGTFLFAAVGKTAALYVVPAAGGTAKRIEVKISEPAWPEFLPGSEDFLFFSLPTTPRIEESEIYLATLRDGRAADPVLLMKNATAARYTRAGGGRVLFVRNDNLYAQKLNRKARKMEGEIELVQQNVASSPAFGQAHFSVSRTGVVAWRPGKAGLSQVTIFDRQGREIGTAGSPTVLQTLKLAPDETRLLIGFHATAWLLEPGKPGQLQLDQGGLDTLYSPDGSEFLNAIPDNDKVMRVVARPVAGDGATRELASPPGLGRLEDISRDGRTLLFSRGALDTTVFSFRLDDVQKDPKSLVSSGETISHTRFSPDGRWIVYTASAYSAPARGLGSIYSGGGIYVQPFPGPGLRRQVTSHGNYPVWRKDGREIVYLDEYQGRNYIWSVPVATLRDEFRAGTPSPLFPARLPASTFGDLNFLAVSRDGSRFYIPQRVEQPDSGVINVRMGWLK